MADLRGQLRAYFDATCPPVDVNAIVSGRRAVDDDPQRTPPHVRSIPMTVRLDPRPDADEAPDPRLPRRAAVALAVAAVTILAVAGLALFNSGDDDVPADEPVPPTTAPATTVAALSDAEAAAVATAEQYFEAYGAGDADTVIQMSDPVGLNEASERALVDWWSRAARPGSSDAGWPTSPCRVAPGESELVLVECPVAVTDPVAVELAADGLVWTVDVASDGTVRRRAEPLTTTGGSYEPVWSVHADYLAAHRLGDFAGICDGRSVETGQAFVTSGLALTGDCADLVAEHAADAAAWIASGRPAPTIEEPADGDASDASAAAASPAEPIAIPLSADALRGYWTNVGGRTTGWTALLVDFRADGSFTIGNNGDLFEGAFTGGTYEVVGDSIEFAGLVGGCAGETFTWTADRFVEGELEVDVTSNGGCASDANWRWIRVSPASAASLALEEGTASGASARAPESPNHLRGIWLRLGTGQVLAIEPDGSYLVVGDGDSTAPDDTGILRVDEPGTVVFESSGEGECEAGATWTWTDVDVAADLLRENNPRGTTMRTAASDLCGTDGAPTTWRLLSPDIIA